MPLSRIVLACAYHDRESCIAKRPYLIALAAMLSTSPASAQDGPKGIAFVQAPQQGGGVCLGATPEEGFACAAAECTAGSAADEDCIRTNWCQPAGWSVDVFMQHREGPHWHEVICGIPTETIAKAAASHLCDMNERDYLIECSVVQIYDPRGETTMDR
jgi:hypothetical protein